VAVGEDICPYHDTFTHNTLYKKVSALQLWVDILYDYTLLPEHSIPLWFRISLNVTVFYYNLNQSARHSGIRAISGTWIFPPGSYSTNFLFIT
jgi:hypothetical protein